MKVTGIIAEYNPFHKGHQYQIQFLKSTCQPDYVVIAMGGNFLQRGAPALTDKYLRAEMALAQGADLVLELPVRFATASAEGFARGGIRLFTAAGLVNSVCFGTESPDFSRLQALSRILDEEPGWYRNALSSYLKEGFSFPAARAMALPEYQDLLQTPNNILALEYLKAIRRYNAGLLPLPVLRAGNGYHDASLSGPHASASAIRERLREDKEHTFFSNPSALSAAKPFADSCSPAFPPELADALPRETFRLLEAYYAKLPFLWEEDFSLLLHQRLLQSTRESLLQHRDMSEALANRILAKRKEFLSWPSFCEALKTKDLTYTRISRAMTSLLLNLKGPLQKSPDAPANALPYLRVLGFRQSAAPLLAALQEKASCPVITSPVLAESLLDDWGMKLFQEDLYAADLYRSVLVSRTGRMLPNEYTRKLLVCK